MIMKIIIILSTVMIVLLVVIVRNNSNRRKMAIMKIMPPFSLSKLPAADAHLKEH